MEKIPFTLTHEGTTLREEHYPWAKHHKKMGYCVGVEKFDQSLEEAPFYEKWHADKKYVEVYHALKNTAHTFTKVDSMVNFDTGKNFKQRRHFIVLENQAYQEADVSHYSIGASNTKQMCHIRLIFQLEYDRFIFDMEHRSTGFYAETFGSFLEDVFSNMVDYLEEKKEAYVATCKQKKEEPDAQSHMVRTYGIYPLDEDESEFKLVVVGSKSLMIDEFDIEKEELKRSLIGVEVYQFDMEIMSKDQGA
ncbi:hypothetical protein HCJ39_07025 [Listeria rocourtiae]|uniref:hypothetical protein n=1 Tax=Listeria rocourtiae TaxID=647910 RepID=UPI0016293D47|nr:hypothetical protein [Listeria rocourtiae]MBC1604462.1 hypothetical protein [Listeria rocourtiae]